MASNLSERLPTTRPFGATHIDPKHTTDADRGHGHGMVRCDPVFIKARDGKGKEKKEGGTAPQAALARGW